MTKPEDIPQDVWERANVAWVRGASSENITNTGQETVARAILAERERCAAVVKRLKAEAKSHGLYQEALAISWCINPILKGTP